MKRRLFVKALGASIPAAAIATGASAAPVFGGIKPRAASLGLPPVYDTLTHFRSGLVIIASPVNGGKSTTLRYLMERFANTQKADIAFPDDQILEPVAFDTQATMHTIGREFSSFGVGMFDASDPNPSLIVVGEIRHWDTLRECLTLAEAGHLVYGTVHGSTAWNTIARLIHLNHFEADGQTTTRERLARTLRAVMAQKLISRKDGRGRVPAADTITSAEFFQEQLRLTPYDILATSLVPDSARHPADVSMQSSIARLLRDKKIAASAIDG